LVSNVTAIVVLAAPVGAGTAWLLFHTRTDPAQQVAVAAGIPTLLALTAVTTARVTDRQKKA
jgi:hypothetical protein